MSAPTPFLETLRRRAAADPDRPAFELDLGDETVVMSYGTLTSRVARLGEGLVDAGIGDGARLALCFENRPAWAVAYLATWYAGGVTVPLDSSRDASSLARLLEHSETRAVFVSPATLDTVLEARGEMSTEPLIVLFEPVEEAGPWDGGGEAAAQGGGDGPAAGRGALPDNVVAASDLVATRARDEWNPRPPDGELGSLMYTSGTTGAPKGVMVRRGAVVENLEAALETVDLTEDDRLLGVLPLFHVLPLITNCLGPLYLGASVVFLEELTAEGIMAAFRRHEITIFVCVPAFFYRFYDKLTARVRAMPGWRRAVVRSLLWVSARLRRGLGIRAGRRLLTQAHEPFGPAMRLFVTGGAKMSADVYESFLDWGFVLAQGYGLTEATAVLTVSPLDDLRGDTVGRPIPGVELRIDDPGEDGIGEVLARTPAVMLGYYRDQEATEAVLDDGWLRTGDLGRLLSDGHLQVTGRAKDTIVLPSGKNIYPDEVEGAYEECELVDEICIVGLPDEAGRGERLHAVVVPDLDAARRRDYVNVREMVRWEIESVSSRLPGPQRITSLEIRNEPLPRTPTRKVQRYKVLEGVLERREGGEPGAETEEERPAEAVESTDGGGEVEESGHEARVLQIVARHAGGGRPSRDDHLDIDLGLESLDRVELYAEIGDRLGIELGTAAAEIHTVSELLEAVEEASTEGAGEASGEGGEAWTKILAKRPDGLEPYLRRKPVSEVFLWLAARLTRALYGLVVGFRGEGVENLPAEPPFMICPNHASYTDPFFLALTLPYPVLRRCFYVGYSEYFEGRFGRLFARWIRNVPIDANRNLERALQAAAEGLRRDMVLVIFPEGGRSVDGTVREFRKGAAIVARHLEVPIVPVGIAGTFETWPRGGKIKPHPVAIVLGEPLRPDAGKRGADAEALTEALRARVVDRLGAARRLLDGAGGATDGGGDDGGGRGPQGA